MIQEQQLSVTGESMCTKYCMVNSLGGLSLPSVVRLTDCPDMNIAVYHGCKTTTHQIQQNFDRSNTDGSFTTAVSNSFLSPLEKNLIAADLG